MRIKNDQKVSEVSAFFALGVFIVVMIALTLIFIKVWRLSKTLNEESIDEFNSKYSKLTESLKETKIDLLVFLWRPLNLARWLLTVTVLIVFKSEPGI
jgi:predicted negative regulator of RcsB-dependent stress response